MDDQKLMEQVKKGDHTAFEKIVRSYKNRIVNFLWRLTHDYQKSVELAQETFMRVYFKANKYKPIAPLSSWIYSIASNLAKTEMKKRQKHPVVSIDEIRENTSREVASVSPPSNSERIRNLRKALNSLSPRYRIPVILKDIEGFSQEEIANILKKPVGTVKARVSRGRKCLRKELEKYSIPKEKPQNKEEGADGRIG
ncbi:RNA polymerase sigma factor [bacterium]|nr:RNA polymerase sigma factor [bacterium]